MFLGKKCARLQILYQHKLLFKLNKISFENTTPIVLMLGAMYMERGIILR